MMVALVASAWGAAAAATVDLGEIVLGRTYRDELKQYADIRGHFTAPTSGTVALEGALFDIYTDSTYTEQIDPKPTAGGYGNLGSIYVFEAAEGKAYYFHVPFFMGTGLRVSMNSNLEFSDVIPAEGEYISAAGEGNIKVNFNTAVTVGRATISCGNATARVTAAATGSTILVGTASALNNWYSTGVIEKDKEFTLTLSGIKAVAGGGLYDGTGTMTLKFKAAAKPTRLVEYKMPKTFKSYFVPGDPEAVAWLTFDGELYTEKPSYAVVTYGNVEGADGEYYVEKIPVTIEGNKASIDLSGKTRRAADMVVSATLYKTIGLAFQNLRDVDGNYVAAGAGSLGSFSYGFDYYEIPRVNVASEFLPAHGGSLQGVEKLELWIRGMKDMQFSGFRFAYPGGETVVPTAQAVREDDNENESVFYIPVPKEVQGRRNITVSLADLQCTDGVDHSGEVKAVFDAFVVTYSNPKNGAELSELAAGAKVVLSTNYDGRYPEMSVKGQIVRSSDFAAGANDNVTMVESVDLSRSADETWVMTMPEKVRLTRGYQYALELTAWMPGAEAAFDSTQIVFYGTGAPFVASDYTVVGVSPKEGSELTPDSCVVTVEFDGSVMLTPEFTYAFADGERKEFVKVVAEDPQYDEETGITTSSVWSLHLDAAWLAGVKGSVAVRFQAVDTDDHVLVGNCGKEDGAYHEFVFNLKGQVSIKDVLMDSSTCVVYNLQGVAVRRGSLEGLPAGVYVANGRKVVVR